MTINRIITILATIPVLVAPAAASAADGSAPDIPAMEEVSKAAGLIQSYDGPWEFYIGGGAASFDCNGDRMPDLFIAGGTNAAKFYVNRSKPSGPLRFEAKSIGLSAARLKKVLGAYPINIDNDQFTDLVILRLGENLILKGGPDCTFTAANGKFAFDGGTAWTSAFSAIWEDGATYPTLAFGNYVDRTAPGTPWGTCDKNVLARPRNTASGVPDYSESLTLEPSYCPLSMLFTDWNNSGRKALRIANDRQYYRGGSEQLWAIPPAGIPRQYTAAQGWKKLRIWGMGIAETDLDQDGRPEYALSSMGDTKLQVLDDNAGDDDRPTYRDMALEKTMTAHRPYVGTDLNPSTGWHTQFADFNNDTRTDLFIAKGNVEEMPQAARFDPDNMLLGGKDGKFHERGYEAGIALPTKGRGAVVEDFNADGMLDLVVVNRGSNVTLFRNTGARTKSGTGPLGNWLGIELQNGKINPAAIGAKIVIKTGNLSQSRTVQIGGGHASGQTGFIHFGLGAAERATIRVQWPDGDRSEEYRVFANNFVVISRGKPDVLYWRPKPAP